MCNNFDLFCKTFLEVYDKNKSKSFSYKISMIFETLILLAEKDKKYLMKIREDCWTAIFDSFFRLKNNNIIQNYVIRAITSALTHQSETFIIKLLIGQNLMSRMVDVIEEEKKCILKNQQYQYDFFMYLIEKLREMIDQNLEANSLFKSIQKPIMNSSSWKQIQDYNKSKHPDLYRCNTTTTSGIIFFQTVVFSNAQRLASSKSFAKP